MNTQSLLKYIYHRARDRPALLMSLINWEHYRVRQHNVLIYSG